MNTHSDEKIRFKFVQDPWAKYRLWLLRASCVILFILFWMGISFYFGKQFETNLFIFFLLAVVFIPGVLKKYPIKIVSQCRAFFDRTLAFGKPYFDEYSFSPDELRHIVHRKHWIWPGYLVTIPPLENAMRELVKGTYYKTPIEEHTLACVTNIDELKEVVNKNLQN